MATSDRKRQEKVERRAAKQKKRNRSLIQEKNRGLAEWFRMAAAAPILHCCATRDFWETGMSSVLISRELPRQKVAYAMFLIDRYCLGVKDAMGKVVSRSEYNATYLKLGEKFTLVPLPPPDMRRLVEDAIDFARESGFEPYRDYLRVKAIFGDIDAAAATERFNFGGADGKPHFMAGPHDNALRCREIIQRLENSCGPGGYYYTIPFPGAVSVSQSDDVLRITDDGTDE